MKLGFLAVLSPNLLDRLPLGVESELFEFGISGQQRFLPALLKCVTICSSRTGADLLEARAWQFVIFSSHC